MFKSFRRAVSLFFCLIFLTAAYAANPNGYYNGVTGKKNKELKTALSVLLLNHTIQEYNSLWGFFPSTDARPDGSVWDMYSNVVRFYGSTNGMNREHSFPKSWWGGAVNAAYTDINHLYPSDGEANMAKSNYPLGIVTRANFNNSVTKVGYNTSGSMVFEPSDEYKGDFARTYFYMVTCYQDYNWKYLYMVDNNVYPTLQPWASSMLLQWHRQDPVSDKERNRNEAVFKIQNNRNPYIDYPQLAEYIWGDSVNSTFMPSSQVPVSTPILATPTNDTELDFGYAIVGSVKKLLLYVKGSNLTNNLKMKVWPEEDYVQFGVSASTLTKESSNSGTYAGVDFKPGMIGNFKASVVVYDGGLSSGSVLVHLKGVSIPTDSLRPPTPVAATSITSTTFTANWEYARYADFYRLQLYEVDNGHALLVKTFDSIPDNSFDISDLNPNKNYSYSLKARIGNVFSAESFEMPVSLLSGIVNAMYEGGLSVYANGSTVYVQAPAVGMQVELFDYSGKLVGQLHSTGHVQLFENLPLGLYLVRCNGFVQKIMVRR